MLFIPSLGPAMSNFASRRFIEYTVINLLAKIVWQFFALVERNLLIDRLQQLGCFLKIASFQRGHYGKSVVDILAIKAHLANAFRILPEPFSRLLVLFCEPVPLYFSGTCALLEFCTLPEQLAEARIFGCAFFIFGSFFLIFFVVLFLGLSCSFLVSIFFR